MTLEDLRTAFRSAADDTAQPYLWGDDEIRDWLNEAQAEACERGKLLLDTRTPEVCQIAVVAGTAEYDLHPSILEIRRVVLLQPERVLPFVPLDQLDQAHGGWMQQTGTPECWTRQEPGRIQLVPAPTADATVTLRVYRTPLEEMSSDFDEPEIAQHYHRYLLDWALHRAFSKRDADTYDEGRAKGYEADFERRFGERLPASVRQMRAASSNWTVAYGG